VRARWRGPAGTIRLNGMLVTVIGIAPRDVAAPDPSVRIWLPLVVAEPSPPPARERADQGARIQQ